MPSAQTQLDVQQETSAWRKRQKLKTQRLSWVIKKVFAWKEKIIKQKKNYQAIIIRQQKLNWKFLRKNEFSVMFAVCFKFSEFMNLSNLDLLFLELFKSLWWMKEKATDGFYFVLLRTHRPIRLCCSMFRENNFRNIYFPLWCLWFFRSHPNMISWWGNENLFSLKLTAETVRVT